MPSVNDLLPELAEAARYLDQVVHASGLQGRFTSTTRSHAEQKRLYDRFLRGEAQFPALPPGLSAHEFGWAFDYLVSPYDYQPDVGAYWNQMGGVWRAGDAVHFEYPGFNAALQEFSEDPPPWWLEMIASAPLPILSSLGLSYLFPKQTATAAASGSLIGDIFLRLFR